MGRLRISPAQTALICAILLVASAVGPWRIPYQPRAGDGWAVNSAMLLTSPSLEAGPPYEPGLLGYTGYDRVLIPMLGLLALVPLLSVPGAFGPFKRERRAALLWATAVFLAAGVLVLVATDTAQASLGWGQWQSRVLGGFRPYTGGHYANHPLTAGVEARRGWGWGAGLAAWVSLGGVIACAGGWRPERADRGRS